MSSKAKYRVLVVIKDNWYSFDDQEFTNFPAARRHQTEAAKECPKNETAIGRGADILSFRESENYIAEDRKLRKEENAHTV